MRFPSIDILAARAVAVLQRFPWTLAAGAVTAVAAILASRHQTDASVLRVGFVAGLALPLTIALTLTSEVRRWTPVVRTGSLLAGVAVLVLFYLDWQGLNERGDGVRYLQFSAALHLAVAFLPFVAIHQRVAFWQYNRRLFLGFLKSAIFSAVIFVGVAIALGALDKLFGVHIDGDLYLDIWFVTCFVVNSWIFLSTIPDNLESLADDHEYPKALKVFAQYILTPLAFVYLLILLAYLVKIVAGAEWPNGWIGWLVASVSVTGILGYLLVEPLRSSEHEGWIRIYARWFFLGLIPAALMLLAAFWKRIEPYGLTEPRTLGMLLGIWLLGTAILFSLRPGSSIKLIPMTLSFLLLVTLFGPVSVTRLSIQSQGRRFVAMLADTDSVRGQAEASAALRFLIDRRAEGEIADRIGKPFPSVDWTRINRDGPERDTLGMKLMALAGAAYVEQGRSRINRNEFNFSYDDGQATAVEGFRWLATVNAYDTTRHVVGPDTVQALRASNGIVNVAVGHDTLHFDLHPLFAIYRDSLIIGRGVPASALRILADSGRRAGALLLRSVDGKRAADSLILSHWDGRLLFR
ncbi:MAG: DUF4153 domain-containing protein [Gemmatimonadota bacterium]